MNLQISSYRSIVAPVHGEYLALSVVASLLNAACQSGFQDDRSPGLGQRVVAGQLTRVAVIEHQRLSIFGTRRNVNMLLKKRRLKRSYIKLRVAIG